MVTLFLTLLCTPNSPAQLPPSVDLRNEFANFEITPKHQGDRDSCSLFAIAALAEFELKKAGLLKGGRLSEEFLIWASNESTGLREDQAMFYEAVHALQELGICAESAMPYQAKTVTEDPTEIAREQAQQFRGWRVAWIKRWNLNGGLSLDQLSMVKQMLAKKHPVAIGCRWPKGAEVNAANELPYPPPDGVFDGHSVLLVGFVDHGRYPGGGAFLFQNSYGSSWGNNGYGIMPYAYAQKFTNDAIALRKEELSDIESIVIEMESLGLQPGSTCSVNEQSMRSWGAGLWSEGKHLFCESREGGVARFEFVVPQAGNYAVDLLATCAPDFGAIQVSVNGAVVARSSDLYGGRVYPSGRVSLGEMALTGSPNQIEFRVIGKNQHSSGYFMGLDAIVLTQRN
ncbi:MAG: C1 family peptidase [Verrucomicrobiales bacterium]|nr:C1 family peptidase [Verrucomicrobiales bacterium]